MKIQNLNEIDRSALFLRRLEDSGVEEIVRNIIADVAQDGDRALIAYAKKFDRAELDSLEVTPEELNDALLSMPTELLDAMQTAAENIREFHSMQLREGFRWNARTASTWGRRSRPSRRLVSIFPAERRAILPPCS